MSRCLSGALGALLLVGCGGSDEIGGVTAECTLDPIVAELVRSGAVNCSPAHDQDGLPTTLYFPLEPTDDTPVIDCVRDALALRNDAVYISALIAGTDSLGRFAKFVNADGGAILFSYDSSPSGQGSGSNTVLLYECAPFSVDPSLGCEDQRMRQVVCSQDESLRARLL